MAKKHKQFKQHNTTRIAVTPFLETEVVLSVNDGKHSENIVVAQNGEVYFDNLHGHSNRIGE